MIPLGPDDDAVCRGWLCRLMQRRAYLKAERIMREIREAEGCSTGDAVRATAVRLGHSERWVWRALRRLKRPPRRSPKEAVSVGFSEGAGIAEE